MNPRSRMIPAYFVGGPADNTARMVDEEATAIIFPQPYHPDTRIDGGHESDFDERKHIYRRTGKVTGDGATVFDYGGLVA